MKNLTFKKGDTVYFTLMDENVEVLLIKSCKKIAKVQCKQGFCFTSVRNLKPIL